MLTQIRNVGRAALDTVASDLRSVGNFVARNGRALMLGGALVTGGLLGTGTHQPVVELAFNTPAHVTQVILGERVAAPMFDAAQTLSSVEFMSVASAEPAIELPDTGVDIEGLIGAAILGLGSIVVVAVGGYFGFLLVRLGLRWARTMAG